MLNDISAFALPLEKHDKAVKLLLARLKQQIRAQTHEVRLYDVVDGAVRLKIDALNSVIKEKIIANQFARSAKEVSALLYFVANELDKNPGEAGKESERILRTVLLPCLKSMQFRDLSVHQFQYILLSLSIVSRKMTLEAQEKLLVQDALQPLQENCARELMHSDISDVLTLIQTFREVDRVTPSESNLRFVMKALEAYLEEYLQKSKKFLTGSTFALLCDHMAFAKEHELHEFDSKLL